MCAIRGAALVGLAFFWEGSGSVIGFVCRLEWLLLLQHLHHQGLLVTFQNDPPLISYRYVERGFANHSQH